jgi:signal transduction histidine kinase
VAKLGCGGVCPSLASNLRDGRGRCVIVNVFVGTDPRSDLRAGESMSRSRWLRSQALERSERRRLAESLHDHQIQGLTALQLQLGVLEKRLGTHPQTDMVRRLQETLGAAIEEMRHFMHELHPASLDRAGLVVAVQDYVGESMREGDVEVTFSGHVPPGTGLEPTNTMYQIVQEALSNVCKHAHALHVGVLFEGRDGGITVQIRDDGRGFSERELVRHSGLDRMAQRASIAGGWFRSTSVPGEGTIVTAWIPR